jgi:SAM-dependent methyltransferase
VAVAWDDLPRLISEFGDVDSRDRILDVPCSDGALAFQLAPGCGYVVGADASETMIAAAALRAVEEGIDNISFQVGRAEHLEFADGTFDRVICWDGLHHFADPAAVIRELARVLRPPGYLIAVDIDPSEDRAWRETHNRIERSRDPSHVALYTRPQVRSFLVDCGMTVERETRWQARRPFELWMAPVDPDEGTLERTRRLLTEASRKKSAGLEISVKGRSIELVHRLAAWLAIKLT